MTRLINTGYPATAGDGGHALDHGGQWVDVPVEERFRDDCRLVAEDMPDGKISLFGLCAEGWAVTDILARSAIIKEVEAEVALRRARQETPVADVVAALAGMIFGSPLVFWIAQTLAPLGV